MGSFIFSAFRGAILAGKGGPYCPLWSICMTAMRRAERQVRVYSVEKLETNDDAIFRQRERAGIDWPLTCIQADARARTEASAAT